MSNAFTDSRAALAALLDDPVVPAYAVIPEAAEAPFSYVFPGDPYIEYEGATFGGEILHHSVGIVLDHGDNDTTAEDLDTQVIRVLDLLAASEEFHVERVGQPGSLSVNGQPCLGVTVETTTEIHR